MKKLSELELGDVIYKAAPWDGQVHRRHVVCIVTSEYFDPILNRTGTTSRVLHSSNGIGIGEELTDETWGTRYFPDLETARRACCEQAVCLKEERDAQIRQEIKELQRQLEL